MAKGASVFACQECGATYPKWSGRCDACGAWNTILEEVAAGEAPGGLGKASSRNKGKKIEFVGLASKDRKQPPRIPTGMAEFDRVAGGGLVPGAAILVGGDPGIGKSTLLLQVTAALAANVRCVYISGEEAVDQVRLRAERLGLAGAPVDLAAATNVRDIVASLDDANAPQVVVADSIQTLFVDSLDSAPGTVAQVRASAQELIRLCKRRGIVLFLVGHVTKEGTIAGPKVLEHMVDTVLYFEGERGHQFRILRAVKNRFGPADEIGVFEMSDSGLSQVGNPSALFLADRDQAVSGTSVFAGMEGTRPVLVEIQALTAPTSFGTPRRAVVGWDGARLNMVLAVLEARCGLSMGQNDVYLNVAGGLRISEPAADLAAAAALVSSLNGSVVPADTVVFGEIGLSGEVRPVSREDARLKEAGKLGFKRAVVPETRGTKKERAQSSNESAREREAAAQTVRIRHLNELLDLLQAPRQRAQQAPARPAVAAEN